MKKLRGNISTYCFDNFKFEFTQRVNFVYGNNGSGKTTFLKCICKLIKFDGVIEDSESNTTETEQISFYFSGDEFLEAEMTVDENCKYFLKNFELDKNFYEIFGLKEKKNVKVMDLSEGYKQKLRLFITLSRDKKYYIIDEPTNYLDVDSIKKLADYLVNIETSSLYIIATNDINFLNFISSKDCNILCEGESKCVFLMN